MFSSIYLYYCRLAENSLSTASRTGWPAVLSLLGTVVCGCRRRCWRRERRHCVRACRASAPPRLYVSTARRRMYDRDRQDVDCIGGAAWPGVRAAVSRHGRASGEWGLERWRPGWGRGPAHRAEARPVRGPGVTALSPHADYTHTPVWQPLFREYPGEPVPERKNQSGFHWSKR